jgi:hypothetical protein
VCSAWGIIEDRVAGLSSLPHKLINVPAIGIEVVYCSLTARPVLLLRQALLWAAAISAIAQLVRSCPVCCRIPSGRKVLDKIPELPKYICVGTNWGFSQSAQVSYCFGPRKKMGFNL